MVNSTSRDAIIDMVEILFATVDGEELQEVFAGRCSCYGDSKPNKLGNTGFRPPKWSCMRCAKRSK